MAGGLGVRITNLASTLARLGYLTHLFFIGDPRLPGYESLIDDKLVLHRWCQWISEYYPGGVYQGENEKLHDFEQSIPNFIADNIISPTASDGIITVVLAEEWHTAETLCRLHDELVVRGIREQSILFWNANNTFSFHRIGWNRLKACATVTTVSRYMKHKLWEIGANPLVVPNGIPSDLLRGVRKELIKNLRDTLNAAVVLSKVARWDPAKGWKSAVGAAQRLKERGIGTTLLVRGGLEPYGDVVRDIARSLGLTVSEATLNDGSNNYLYALKKAMPADIIDLRFPVPLDFLRIIYRACDAVLANSGHEPFGLVGLEAMAVGGIVFTGDTGEDYAIPHVNAFVMDTDDSREIESAILYLRDFPEEALRVRHAAKATARHYTWEATVKNLLSKLEHQARLQGLVRKKEPLRDSLPVSMAAA